MPGCPERALATFTRSSCEGRIPVERISASGRLADSCIHAAGHSFEMGLDRHRHWRIRAS